jgi:hypothetical protein
MFFKFSLIRNKKMSFRSNSINDKPKIPNVHENPDFDINEASQYNFNYLNHEDINLSNSPSFIVKNEANDTNSDFNSSNTDKINDNQNENFASKLNDSTSNNSVLISETVSRTNEIKQDNFINESMPTNTFLEPNEQIKMEQKLKNENFSPIIYENNKKLKDKEESKKLAFNIFGYFMLAFIS